MSISSQGTYKNLVEMLDIRENVMRICLCLGQNAMVFMNGLLMNSLQKS